MVQIIDASVAIKWFVAEKNREPALAILADLFKAPAKFAVPEIFYFELAHVFHRVIPSPSALQIHLFDNLLKLGIQRFVFTPELAKEVRHFQALGLSGYDASYVGLAKILKGQWLTFDSIAHKKITHLKLSKIPL